MTKANLKRKKQWLEDIRSDFFLPEIGGGELYHYTSLPVLFSILENDAVWVSSTRFSNDSSEEFLMKNKEFTDLDSMRDSFIMCFSNKADCLSQWRGYCFGGGAAIEFDVKQPQLYSVLHADYDVSHRYELELNAPLSVLYVNHEQSSTNANSLAEQLRKDSENKLYAPWGVGDVIPFFKNEAFVEESEWRLMFGNKQGEFSKCVRFRTQNDGVKVPYMVVKSGDVGRIYSRCEFPPEEYNQSKLDELRENKITTVRIPQGNDQEAVYYKVEQAVNKYNKDKGLKGNYRIRIYCEGHLPIRRIIVAPTYNRERIAEKIKRYCWSNYWLRDIDVVYSRIPYIPPAE